MITVKVLGTGCANCKKLEAVTLDAIKDLGDEIIFEKVTDPAQIYAYPIMSTPGLVINEKVVSAGRIPSKDEIKSWINTANG